MGLNQDASLPSGGPITFACLPKRGSRSGAWLERGFVGEGRRKGWLMATTPGQMSIVEQDATPSIPQQPPPVFRVGGLTV